MSGYKGQEKRRVARCLLTTFCPATFSHSGQDHSALMTNVSQAGAQFRLQEHGRRCDLARGEEVDYRVHTPYGSTVCRGRTVWTRDIDGQWCWGVTFTKISDDPNDPLRALMEASF